MLEWIIDTVQRTGYLGIALLMCAENVFPPIPSELIMPLVGFAAARGDVHLVPAVAAGTGGSLAGTLVWYVVGRWFGVDRLRMWAARHGRWFTVSPAEIDTAMAWFQRHCGKAVFFGRLVPGVRTLISVPAGIAGMSPAWFVLYSGLGSAVWSTLLATAGYHLEDEYARVSAYVNPVSNLVIAALVVWYVVRVIMFRRDG